jgi:pimeloyl-ACP methyl ester carboxylesterase
VGRKRVRRAVLTGLGIFLLLLVVVPLLIPIPPLEDTVPAEELADGTSRFEEIGGLRVHYKLAGSGTPGLVLLHGFGASLFSWREVMQPLAAFGTVVAFDRPAFGLTERPMPGDWRGDSPYSPERQVDATVGLMDRLGMEEAVLVGHSAGGRIAALTALRYPQRVRALVLVAPALGAGGGPPKWLNPLLRTPQMRRLGPLLVRSISSSGQDTIRLAWHEPERITREIMAGYTEPLLVENWDRALWEHTISQRAEDLGPRLHEIAVPVMVITGDDDRIVPPDHSADLVDHLSDARLVVTPHCGHLPHEERPDEFVDALADFLSGLS